MGKKHNKNKQNYNITTTEKTIDNEAKAILDKVASQHLPIEDETDLDEMIKIFNANQLKKTMQRILKSNQLLDVVTEEALDRFLKNRDEFTNQDLLNYMKVMQDSINNSQKALSSQQEKINKPLIQINQQNITTNEPLSKESQEKILNVVEELMKLANSEKEEVIEGEVVEVEGDSNE